MKDKIKKTTAIINKTNAESGFYVGSVAVTEFFFYQVWETKAIWSCLVFIEDFFVRGFLFQEVGNIADVLFSQIVLHSIFENP